MGTLFSVIAFVFSVKFAAGFVAGAAAGWKTVRWLVAKAQAEAKKIGA